MSDFDINGHLTGPDPSFLVQRIMRQGMNKEEWIAYDAIIRLYDQAPGKVREAIKVKVNLADKRMATLYAAEQRRALANERRAV